MAKDDDLSVNLNIGVEINQQDLKKTKEELSQIKQSIDDINNANISVGSGSGSGSGSVYSDIQNAIEGIKTRTSGSKRKLNFNDVISEVISSGDAELGKAWKKIEVGSFKAIDSYLKNATSNIIDSITDIDSDGNAIKRKVSRMSGNIVDAIVESISEEDYEGNIVKRKGKGGLTGNIARAQAREAGAAFNPDSDLPLVKELKDLVRNFNNLVSGEIKGEDYNVTDRGVPEYLPGAAELLGIKQSRQTQFDIIPEALIKSLESLRQEGDAGHLVKSLQEALDGKVLDEKAFNALFDFELRQNNDINNPNFNKEAFVLSPLAFSQILSMVQKSGLGEKIQGYDHRPRGFEYNTDSKFNPARRALPIGTEPATGRGAQNFKTALSLRGDESIAKIMTYLEENALEKLTNILIGVTSGIQNNLEGQVEYFESISGQMPGAAQVGFMANDDRKNLASYDEFNFKEQIGDAEETQGFIRGTVAANIEKILAGINLTEESFFPTDIIKTWLADQLRSELQPVTNFLESKEGQSLDPQTASFIDNAAERMSQIQFEIDNLGNFNKKDADFLRRQESVGLQGPKTSNLDFFEYAKGLAKLEELNKEKSLMRQEVLSLNTGGAALDQDRINKLIDPIKQIFTNPKILGKGFGSENLGTVKGQFTTLLKNLENGKGFKPTELEVELLIQEMVDDQNYTLIKADKLDKLSKRVIEEREDVEMQARFEADKIRKSSPEYLNSPEFKGLQDMIAGYKKVGPDYTPENQFDEVKQEQAKLSEDFAIDFYKTMGGKLEPFAGEFKGTIEKTLETQVASKPSQDIQPQAQRSSYDLGQFGAVFPDAEKLREVLKVIKEGVDGTGETLIASLDTEYNNLTSEVLTEAAIIIKDANGNFIELFKMLSLPGDLNKLKAMAKINPDLNLPKNAEEVGQRADRLGIPRDFVGSPTDKELNFDVFEKNLRKLSEVLAILDQSDVPLAMYNKSADKSAINRSIGFANQQNERLGKDLIPAASMKSVYDLLPELDRLKASSEELNKIIPEVGKDQRKLTTVLDSVYSARKEDFEKFEKQFTMGQNGPEYTSSSGARVGAHTAATDAVALLILQEIFKGLSGRGSLIANNIIDKNLNNKPVTSASGGGASVPPKSPPPASADKSGGEEFDKAAKNMMARIFSAQTEYQKLLSNLTAQEQLALKGRLVGLRRDSDALNIEADLQRDEKRLIDVNQELLELKRSLSTNEIKFAESRQRSAAMAAANPAPGTIPTRARDVVASGTPGGIVGPLTQEQERYRSQLELIGKLSAEKINLVKAGEKLEQQTRQEVLAVTRGKNQSEKYTENLTKQVDATIKNAQAGKDATDQIKNQMQEQVNAQKAVQRQTQSLMNTWVTSRYALYDIGNFYQSAAQNLIRVSRQIFDTTQSYRRFETAFTSVERAMQLVDSSTKDVRDQFILLSETTPVAFEDITRIGTLGAQMGITAQGIIGFTETVAKFSAITGISAETVAQQFGKIAELANVDPTQFENLGSAVAFAGVNAVATEAEILNLTQSIAAVSSQAGITAPEIVGIATALASVGIQAEQSRGVFTRVFADIDRAAQGGGKSLQALSEVTGLSAKQISASWGTEGAANEVFIALLKGLDASDNLTATFDKLNIVETREINTLTRLAKNLDVVMQALADSNMSFEDALFLGESFDKTVDNLDSKISLFKNNVDSLAAALSGTMAVALGNIVDIGSEFLKFLKNAENSFFFTGIAPNLFTFGVLGAGIAAFAAILAKTTAQVYAFRVAVINSLNNPTAVTGIVAQTKALFGFGSGLIEVRDQVSGISERGLIEPINFKSMFGGAKSQQKELLELRNIYMSVGDAAKRAMDEEKARLQAMGEEKARSYSAIELSRMEADAANKQLLAKRLEIETLENSLNPEQVAKGAAMRTAYSQAYVVAVGTEIKVLTAAQLQTEKSVVSSSNLSRAKKAEAMAHLNNAQAVNLETKAAAGGVGKVGGMIGKAVGIIGILTTAIMLAEMLGSALGQIGKIDLTESGGGMESFREAIKEDTLAVKEGTMEAVATAEIEYNTYRTEVDKTATAIGKITGVTGKVADGFRKVTKQINTQNISLGENSKKWLANAIFNNPELKKWRESDPLAFDKMQIKLEELGMSFDGVLAGFVKNAEGSDVNPLAPLQKQLENFEAEKARILSKNKGSGRLISEEDKLALTGVMDEIDTIKKTLNMFNGVKNTIIPSIAGDGQKAAIDKFINGTESGILKLIDAYKKAAESGKGMAKVVSKVKIESISMLKEIDGLNPKLEIDINAQETVQGIYAVLEAAIKAKENLYVMSGALDKVGTSAAWTGAVSMAAIIAKGAGTENDRKILQDLMIMINSLGSGLDKIDGSGAALTIAELIALANEGTVGIMNFREAIRSLGKTMKENEGFDLNTASGATNTQAILAVLDAIGTKSGITMKKALNNTKVFKLVLQDMGAPAAAIALVDKVIKKLGGSSAITAKEGKRLRKEFAFLFESFQTNLAAGAAEAVDSVENKIRSLTDFVSDLRGVLQSAFEVRYGAQTGLDAITSAWFNLTKAAEDAQKAVKSANDEINQSLADKTVLEYQLSVAQRYNDEKRSAVIRAKLAKLDQQILDQQQQLAEANGANDKSLTGNTKSAIDNRAKVRDLVTQYNSYLLSLANTNMSSTDLAAKAKELEADFLAQGLALGYAEAELKTYTQAFAGDFTTVLAGVPRDITITVNTDPALRAIEEFAAKAREALSTIVAPVAAIAPVAAGITDEEKRYANLFRTGEANKQAGPDIMGRAGEVVKGPKGTTWAWDSKSKEWDRVAKKAMGGYVSGPGGPTSDSIPAMLSNGEYVINSRSVGAYGLDFMNALNQQRVGFAPTQGSFNGGSSGGSQMVYLSPEDRALLRAAVDRPIALYTENAKIAQSANAGNVLLAQRGTN